MVLSITFEDYSNLVLISLFEVTGTESKFNPISNLSTKNVYFSTLVRDTDFEEHFEGHWFPWWWSSLAILLVTPSDGCSDAFCAP